LHRNYGRGEKKIGRILTQGGEESVRRKRKRKVKIKGGGGKIVRNTKSFPKECND